MGVGNDAGWYQFRKWLEYFGTKWGRVTVAVNPAYTSQNCSSCGATVKKSLSTRTHVCECGCVLDRDGKCLDPVQPVVDHNAAINILNLALGTVGHTGTWINHPNASAVRPRVGDRRKRCDPASDGAYEFCRETTESAPS